jgi:hypothetical protein
MSIHCLDDYAERIETVLLLLGLGVTGASWFNQVPALTRAGSRVIALEAGGLSLLAPAWECVSPAWQLILAG